MYRSVILEFINANSQSFKNAFFNQMTLVLLAKKPSGIAKLIDDDNEVIIYHIKNQYTFEKKYDINNLNGTIVEMALDLRETMSFNYDEFTYEIKDPYYLKDLREQSFKTIKLIPVFEKDVIVGVSIIYLDDDYNINISNQKWLTFYKKLVNSLDEVILNKVNSLIIDEQSFYVIVKNKKTDVFYLNENVIKYFRLNENTLNKKDLSYKKIAYFLPKMKNITYENLDIYFLSKRYFEKDSGLNMELYLHNSINYHGFKNEYTLIYSTSLEEDIPSFSLCEMFINAFKKMGLEIEYKCYQIKSGHIAILIDKMLSKKEENDLRFILKKQYYLVITSPKIIPLGVDLIKITNYLAENLPLDFSYDEYKVYQNNINIEKYECVKNSYHENKIIIKADTLDTIGYVINGPIPNYYNLSNYKLYELELINTFEKVLKKEVTLPVFTILLTSVSRRKIYELLKKVILKYPNAKLILHLPVIMDINPQELFETIIKIKALGYVIIVDSTIFMNLKYNNTLKIVDALIIRKAEMEEALSVNNPYNQKLFESLYNDGKVIIFEEIPKEKDASLVNELTCLMINK